MKTVYSILWLSWIAMFFGVELSALFGPGSQYTLSDYVWRAESLGGPWTFGRYVIAVGCLWLAGHFIFGWWR